MNNRVETILASLVSFDTTSRESNLSLIDYIRHLLADYGVESQLFFDDGGRKANLYARLGPAGDGGVMLSGHTDVVPVDGQQWTVPPFALTRSDNRYYGRGTTDMKGFIACVLASVPDFLAQPLRMPLHLAFSYDEEVGCLGVRSLVAHLKASKERPALCIVGEPTQMHPVYGHKGKLALRCEVHGHACHSAYTPHGVNAIEYAAKAIGKLGALGERLAEVKDTRFDPPFSTVQVGVIEGGAALNIVPEYCRFDVEIRHLPDVALQDAFDALQADIDATLVSAMRQVSPASRITFSELSRYPALLTDPQSDFARWLSHWSGSSAFSTVAFGTEGGLFNEAGVATLICGPGSMAQGHKPDEFIATEELEKCMVMLKNLNEWLKHGGA